MHGGKPFWAECFAGFPDEGGQGAQATDFRHGVEILFDGGDGGNSLCGFKVTDFSAAEVNLEGAGATEILVNELESLINVTAGPEVTGKLVFGGEAECAGDADGEHECAQGDDGARPGEGEPGKSCGQAPKSAGAGGGGGRG